MAEILYGLNQVVEFPQAGPGSATDATAKNPLGIVIRYQGKKYRYVKFDNGSGNVAAAATKAAYWKSLDPTTGVWTVTSDYTDSIGGINAVAGIFGCAVTDQYYTWVCVGGTPTCTVDSGTPAGGKMKGSSTDGTLDHIDVGSAVLDNVIGVALNAYDTAGTAEVLLQNLDW